VRRQQKAVSQPAEAKSLPGDMCSIGVNLQRPSWSEGDGDLLGDRVNVARAPGTVQAGGVGGLERWAARDDRTLEFTGEQQVKQPVRSIEVQLDSSQSRRRSSQRGAAELTGGSGPAALLGWWPWLQVGRGGNGRETAAKQALLAVLPLIISGI